MGANPVAIASTALLSLPHTAAFALPRPDSPKARALVLLVLSLTACRAPNRPDDVGHFELRWNGPQAGSLSGPATAGWCAHRKVLQVHAIRGDTGVALAIYPGKALEAGVYRVVDPMKAESVPPAASVALRVLTQNLVQGFQGDTGRVTLDSSRAGRFSGSVSARARSVVDSQRIGLSGTFRDLRVVPDTAGCSPAEPPDEDS
jgi:hypothetical protein